MSARSVEVSTDELTEIAANSGAPILLPAGRAGWARVTVAGRVYRAFLPAPQAVTQ